MTIEQFARAVIDDPAYRQSIVTRAAAGTLPEELELFIWDMASTRMPLGRERKATPSPLLAFHPQTEKEKAR